MMGAITVNRSQRLEASYGYDAVGRETMGGTGWRMRR
jgi:hypothetical protein